MYKTEKHDASSVYLKYETWSANLAPQLHLLCFYCNLNFKANKHITQKNGYTVCQDNPL